MLSLGARDHATILRMLLNDGELARPDPVDPGDGLALPFETAVKIALADLGHLMAIAQQGQYVSPGRWHQLSTDLDTLYHLAVPEHDT